jgi:hypothetical protein
MEILNGLNMLSHNNVRNEFVIVDKKPITRTLSLQNIPLYKRKVFCIDFDRGALKEEKLWVKTVPFLGQPSTISGGCTVPSSSLFWGFCCRGFFNLFLLDLFGSLSQGTEMQAIGLLKGQAHQRVLPY